MSEAARSVGSPKPVLSKAAVAPARECSPGLAAEIASLQQLGNQELLRIRRDRMAGASDPPPANALALAQRGLSGPPSPLPHRRQMERAFGVSLDGITAHVGDTANEAATGLGAAAFTVGRSIAFRDRAPSPRLVAHEVTHALQNRHGSQTAASDARGAEVSHPNDSEEQEAHRISQHVVAGDRIAPPAAASSGDVVVRRDDKDGDGIDDDEFDDLPIASKAIMRLPGVIRADLENSGLGISADFGADLAANVAGELTAIGADAQAQADADVAGRCTDIAGVADAEGNGLSAVITKLFRVRKLDATIVPNDVDLGEFSEGLAFLVSTIGTAGARYIANGFDENVKGSLAGVQNGVDVAAKAAAEPDALLQLELEGVLDALIQARGEFENASTKEERAAAGSTIGFEARQALLLNQALMTLRDDLAEGRTPLEDTVEKAASKIDAIRETAMGSDAEYQTAEQLGDQGELLNSPTGSFFESLAAGLTGHPLVMPIAEPMLLPSINDDGSVVAGVSPEEAFPTLTDSADRKLVAKIADRLDEQKGDLEKLHAEIIPPNPTYTLPEFLVMFHRWNAFFSVEQQAQNPMFRLIEGMMFGIDPKTGNRTDVYDLAGRETGYTGSIARVMFMKRMTKLLEGQLGSTDNTFAGLVKSQNLNRVEQRVSSATSANYNFAEIYGPYIGVSPSFYDEQKSREWLLDFYGRESLERFNALASASPANAHDEAVRQGILDPKSKKVPIARTHRSKSGWAYLIDVTSGDDPINNPVVAREAKTMPPEIVRYLLAKQQHEKTAKPHEAKTRAGYKVGGEHVRKGNVEDAEAVAARKYIEGEDVSPYRVRSDKPIHAVDPTIKKARQRMAAVRPSAQKAADLPGELHAYLDKFFKVNKSSSIRLAAIFQIAHIQYGVGAELQKMLTPESLIQVVRDAAELSLKMAALSSCGPLGKFGAKAYGKKLAMEGVGDAEALASIAGFLVYAGKASSFDQARAWAVMMKSVTHDLVSVCQSLVGGTVTKGLDAVTQKRPETPKQLADQMKELTADPEVAKEIRKDVDAHIDGLAADPATKDGPEHKAAIAFRERLFDDPAKTKTNPDADAPLPGRDTDENSKTALKVFAGARVRTFEEKAALSGAIPKEMRERVIVVEDPSLTGDATHVVYRDGAVRIHVGPDAKPHDVSGHVKTAEKLQRYSGPLGALRRLISRLGSILKIRPGIGDRGWEAKREMEKLAGLIESEAAALAAAKDDSSPGGRTPEQIDARIQALHEQLAKHAEQVDSFEQGRGYIAMEDTSLERAKRGVLKEVVEVDQKGVAGAPGELSVPADHYLRETKQGSGKWVLVYTGDDPTKAKEIDYTTSPPQIRYRPETETALTTKEKHDKARQTALTTHGAADSFAALERRLKKLDPADAAMVRKHRIAIEELYTKADPTEKKKLDELVSAMGSTAADYRAFRHALRAWQVDYVTKLKPNEQLSALKKFLDAEPEFRSEGELFGAYRASRFEKGSMAVQGLKDAPDLSLQMPGGKMADGAVEITTPVADAPDLKPGKRYLIEDKAGDRAFDPSQAERYKNAFASPTNPKRTRPYTARATNRRAEATYEGVIYVFDNYTAAKKEATSIHGLGSRFFVAYFDHKGQLQFLPGNVPV